MIEDSKLGYRKHVLEEFEFENGQTLRDVEVEYTTRGTPKYDEEGNMLIGDICVGTCIESGKYEHYIGRTTCVNDLHGSGAFILMCSQFVEA